jgi:hypothetical protein
VTCGLRFWTSGILDKSKTLSWCSKKGAADAASINWASGQPAGDGCLTLTLSNVTVNDSTFALNDCTTANYFVCEVFVTNSVYAKTISCLQRAMKASETDNAEEECKDLYDITPRMFSCPALNTSVNNN